MSWSTFSGYGNSLDTAKKALRCALLAVMCTGASASAGWTQALPSSSINGTFPTGSNNLAGTSNGSSASGVLSGLGENQGVTFTFTGTLSDTDTGTGPSPQWATGLRFNSATELQVQPRNTSIFQGGQASYSFDFTDDIWGLTFGMNGFDNGDVTFITAFRDNVQVPLLASYFTANGSNVTVSDDGAGVLRAFGPGNNNSQEFFSVSLPIDVVIDEIVFAPTGKDVSDGVDNGNVTLQFREIGWARPGVAVIKASSLDVGSDGFASENDQITYVYEVTNTGRVPLTNVTLSETTFTGLQTAPTPAFVTGTGGATPALLPVGQSLTFRATYDLRADEVALGEIQNQATVSALPDGGVVGQDEITDLSDSSNAGDGGTAGSATEDDVTRTTWIVAAPELALSKLADDATDRQVGETVNYTYRVENTGNVNIENVSISDAHTSASGTANLPVAGEALDNDAGTLGDSTDATSNDGSWDVLAPGDAITFTSQYLITTEDVFSGNDLTNLATATGTPVSGDLTDPTTPETVTLVSLAAEDSPLTPFVCDSSFYEVIDGQLAVLDPATGVYVDIGADLPSYNATGYNVNDNYIYGLTRDNNWGANNNWLIRIGADGDFQLLFDAGASEFQGVMVGNRLYSGRGNTLRFVDVVTGELGTQTFTGTGFVNGLADLAHINAGGVDYIIGVFNGVIYQYNLNASAMTRVLSGASGIPTGSGSARSFGAAWSTSDGIVYFSRNSDGTIFVIDEAETTSPVLLATVSAEASSSHDGMNCLDGGNPFDFVPELTVTKTATDLPTNPEAGDTITYTFEVENTGPILIEDVVPVEAGITVDGAAGTGSLSAITIVTETGFVSTDADSDDRVDALDENETAKFQATYTLSQADVDAMFAASDPTTAVDNSATATGDPRVGALAPVTPSVVERGALSPGLRLTKTLGAINDVNGNGLTDAGDTISWTFRVENVGNAEITGISITDDTANVSGGPITLAAGAVDTGSFTATYTIGTLDVAAGGVENSATVEGLDPNNDPVTDVSDTGAGSETTSDDDLGETGDSNGTGDDDSDPTNDPTVALFTAVPALEVVKSITGFNDVNNSGGLDAGDEVSFSFTVENTGTTALDNISISDAGLSPITLTPEAGFDGDLAVDEPAALVATATYVLTPSDIAAGGIENTATGEGRPVQSDALGNPIPGAQILDGTGTPLANATDASDTGTTPDIDPATGLPEGIGNPEDVETPDLSDGTDTDAGNDPTALRIFTPGVEVVKSVSGYVDTNSNGVVDEGDRVDYSFAVENTGNTGLENVVITDLLSGIVISGSPILTLPEGTTDTSVTASYILQEADIAAGGVENSATATGEAVDSNGDPIGNPFAPGSPLTTSDVSDAGTDPNGDTVSTPDLTETDGLTTPSDNDATNDPTVFSVTPSPSIEVVKFITDVTDVNANGVLDAGDQVTYGFTVTNTGNVALANVLVSDPLFTVSGAAISLGIGASDTSTFSGTHTLTPANVTAGGVENTATVSGDAVDAGGAPILDPITNAQLAATDTSDTGSEPLLNASGDPELATNPETTDSANLAGEIDGDAGNDPTVLIIPNPELTLVKSVANLFDTNRDGLFGGEDDIIEYQFTITNTGNVDLAGITIDDPLFTVAGGPIDLAVGIGDSLSFTGSYLVTAADLTRGYVQNRATATGNAVDGSGNPIYGPGGAPLTALDESDSGTDPDANPVDNPAGTETEDGEGNLDGNPGNDPTVVSVPGNPNPKLSVIKSVSSVSDTSGDGLIGEGDTVTYSFTVTNSGNVDLADVTITDTSALVAGGPISLAVGISDSSTFTATSIISAAEAAAGAVENTADVTGGAVNSLGDPITAPGGGAQLVATDTSDAGTEPEIDVTGTPTTYPDPEGLETPDAANVTDTDPTNDPTVLFLPRPEITLVKSVASVDDTNGNGFTDAGDTLTYSFAVTNSGNTDLTDITVSDTLAGITITGNPIASLGQGVTNDSQIAATYVLTSDDIAAGGVENRASATGTAVDNAGDPLGDPLNPGNPLTVTDDSDAGTAPDGSTVDTPGAEETADLDDVTDGITDNDPTVFQVTPAPMISLTKSVASITDADADGLPSAGDTVNYTFSVTNTGNVDLTNVNISDPIGLPTGGPITLDIGETNDSAITMAYVLTESDVVSGALENTAEASGTAIDSDGTVINDPNTGLPLTTSDISDTGTEPELGSDGTPIDVSTPDSVETGDPDGDTANDPTVLLLPMPELTLIKSVANVFDTNNDGLFGGENDEVVYSFLVTNTGNVALSGVTLSDSLANVSGGPIDLAVGQGDSVSFTATYTVTAADVTSGTTENTATASGTAVDGNGDPLLGLDGAQIGVTDVSDTGTDPDVAPVTDPGGTETEDSDGNTDGDPGNDPTVLSVPSNPNPRLSLIKSVASLTDNGDGVTGVGDTLTFSFSVTNTGNVALGSVSISDPGANVSGGPIALAIGESDTTSFTATRVLSAADVDAGFAENTAEATGLAVNSNGDPISEPGGGAQLSTSDTSDTGTEPEVGSNGLPVEISDPEGNETPDGTGVTDTDAANDPTVFVIPNPELVLTKSTSVVNDTNSDGQFGGPGDVIEYAFTVENTGNVTVADIVISDPTASVSGGPITLAVGALDTTSFTATYTVTQSDIDRGYVENTAEAVGTVQGSDGQPLGNPAAPGQPITVTDTSDTGTDPLTAAIADPSGTDSPDGAGNTDSNPGNDPTVTSVPANPIPEVTIVKSVASVVDTDGDAVLGGEDDTVTYRFDVTNSGNTDLVSVAVNDPLLGGLISTIASLPVGETVTFALPYVITEADQIAGFVENSATATGAAVNGAGTPITDPATGAQLTATDVSDTATDSDGDSVSNPAVTETPDASAGTDGDTTNDPTVLSIPLALPDTGISGIVYLDADEDGTFNTGDVLLAGYTVQIRDADGNIVATTTTDGTGFYEMTGFPIGTHDVEFVDPANGDVVGTLEGLVFDRNTVLTDQDQNLAPPVTPTQLVVDKTTPLSTVVLGSSVPYTIAVQNQQAFAIDFDLVDQLPPGLVYSPGTALIDSIASEPTVNGSSLLWEDITVAAGGTVTVELFARVGPGTPVGDLVNTATALDTATGAALSNSATATVRRNPEAVFDCSDVIGKVFDDRNWDGYQNPPSRAHSHIHPPEDSGPRHTHFHNHGKLAPHTHKGAALADPTYRSEAKTEPGIPHVRLTTPTGTIITTDEYGRYSVPCAELPREMGTNFTLKLDTRSLPTGYRVTTENPRTMRLTAGIMAELNFGATLGRVVDIDLTGRSFEGLKPVVRLAQGLDGLVDQIAKTPSVLRISYFEQGEAAQDIRKRLDAVEDHIRKRWRGRGQYKLIVERTIKRVQ